MYAVVLSLLRRRHRYPQDNIALGAAGERVARRFLKRLGYRILGRNYRCPAGELDLIALDGETIVFAEVRTRRDTTDNDPIDWVPPPKQRQVAKVARYYIHHKNAHERPCRFDVLAVVLRDGHPPEVHHYPEAFTTDR
jgi:putative endonuclease